jgi:hypothetical protein
MENKYSFLIILCCFIFFHCSSTKYAVHEDNNVLATNIEIDTRFRSNPDSTHVFNCNGKKYALKAKKISRAYFPYDLRDCLLGNGFKGDENANKQIAKILRNSEHFDLLIFGGCDAKFRGRQIFEALLNQSQDYRPLNLFGGIEDSEFRKGTVSDAYSCIYCNMIQSIDGWKPYDYIEREVKYQEITTFEYLENGLFNPAYGIEVGTKTYNAILKALQEGRIVFKAYGE